MHNSIDVILSKHNVSKKEREYVLDWMFMSTESAYAETIVTIFGDRMCEG